MARTLKALSSQSILDHRKVRARFAEIAAAVPEIAREANIEGAEYIAQAVKRNATNRLRVRTGELVRSVEVYPDVLPANFNRDVVKSRSLRPKEIGAIIGIGGDSPPYARFLEEGTVNMEAKPFARPAVDEDGPASITMAVIPTVEENLKSVVGKGIE